MTEGQYYAHGKLLLTGEYLVLKGAKALAVPTARGQSLKVSPSGENTEWISRDVKGKTWFSVSLDRHFQVLKTTDPPKAGFLKRLLTTAVEISKADFSPTKFETQLEFPNDWGLGSSSTLTSLVAQSFGIDPFQLFFRTQNGSGYDIACATANGPVLYTLSKPEVPTVEDVALPPAFQDCHLVHLNQKQRSSPEVKRFLQRTTDQSLIGTISALTEKFLSAKTTTELIPLIEAHEKMIGEATGLQPVKEKLFSDFAGAVKSLGAWGGDFALAVGSESKAYFTHKGYRTVFRFGELVP